MDYATPPDVAGLLKGGIPEEDFEWVQNLLDDVEGMIRSRIPMFEQKLAAGKLDEPAIIRAQAHAVKRVVQNPDGRYQEAIAGQYSWTRDQAISSGRLYVDDADLADISSPGSEGRKAFAIDTLPEPTVDPWVAWMLGY